MTSKATRLADLLHILGAAQRLKHLQARSDLDDPANEYDSDREPDVEPFAPGHDDPDE